MIITFYSFKGGVGRSMALANVAEILADLGYSVIVCDWDLEAPGLEHYICDTHDEARSWRAHPGVIDLVEEYKQTVANPKTSPGAIATGEEAERDFTSVGRLRLRRPSSYARFVKRSRHAENGPPSSGSIRLLTAGRRDGEWENRYNKAVSEGDWGEFYDKWAGGAYFEFLRKDLEAAATIVLIDSRTGVTELSGVTTHKLSDLVVLCSAANQQNLQGTEWMAELLSAPQVLAQRGERPLGILPVAARVDLLSESKLVTQFLNDFKSRFARRVPTALGNGQTFLEDSVIPYAGLFSFEETVVARARPSERNPTLFKPYLVLAEALIRWGKHAGLLESHAPGPDPLPTTGVAEATSNRPSPRPTTSVTPAGEFFLSWAETDRDVAADLARMLDSSGLKVWSDLLPDKVRPGQPIATQIQEAIGRSAGYLLLLPREPIGPWLEAEINLALACQARREGYRVLILSQDGSTQIPSELQRFPCIPLPSVNFEAASRIIAELLPTRVLTPEPSPAALLESVKAPTEHESRFFFGRDREVVELISRVEALREAPLPLLIITGPAGSGKTTLLRAGLLPLFQRGVFGPQRAPWQIAYAALTPEAPESSALNAIAKAVGSAPDWPHLFEACEQTSAPLLLCIDNAECLLNQAGEQLILRLLEIRPRCRRGFFVIAISRQFTLAPLRELLGSDVTNDAVYHLPPITAGGIQEYLQGAARLLGVSYETGLLELIGSDALKFAASTRTLGSILQKLWQNRDEKGLLTHAAYRKFDGVEGLLEEDAAKILSAHDERTEGGVRRVITSLIHGRTGALLERSRDDLVAPVEVRHNDRWNFSHTLRFFLKSPSSANELPIIGTAVPNPQNAEALRQLIDANIVVATSDGRFRLANEVVPRTSLVQRWMTMDSEELVRRADLTDAAARWHETGRAVSLLPTRKALGELSRAKFTTPLGFEFIQAAYQQAFAEGGRLFRRGLAVYAVLLVICVPVIVWFADQSSKETDEQLRQQLAAERARWEHDAAEARAAREELTLKAAKAEAAKEEIEKVSQKSAEELKDVRAQLLELKAALQTPPTKPTPTPDVPQSPAPSAQAEGKAAPFIAQLTSPTDTVRRGARKQLAELGPEAIPPMMAAIRSYQGSPAEQDLLAQGVAEAISLMRGRAVKLTQADAATIVGLLSSSNTLTRSQTVEFLRALDDPDSLRESFGYLKSLMTNQVGQPASETGDRAVYHAALVLGAWAGSLHPSILDTAKQDSLAAEVKKFLHQLNLELDAKDAKRWSLTRKVIGEQLNAAERRNAPAPVPQL